MTNIKKLKILVSVLFCFIIILVAMLIYAKTVYTNSDKPSETSVSASSSLVQTGNSQAENSPAGESQASTSNPNAVKETLDLKLYFYDADDYDNVKEIRTVTIDKNLYQEDITSAINKLLETAKLKINKAVVNGSTMTVDLPKEMAYKFNSGSAGGITYTNILAMTLLNLPQIEKLEVTVDGVAGVESDHFSFNGTFTKAENGKKYTFVDSDKKSTELN